MYGIQSQIFDRNKLCRIGKPAVIQNVVCFVTGIQSCFQEFHHYRSSFHLSKFSALSSQRASIVMLLGSDKVAGF